MKQVRMFCIIHSRISVMVVLLSHCSFTDTFPQSVYTTSKQVSNSSLINDTKNNLTAANILIHPQKTPSLEAVSPTLMIPRYSLQMKISTETLSETIITKTLVVLNSMNTQSNKKFKVNTTLSIVQPTLSMIQPRFNFNKLSPSPLKSTKPITITITTTQQNTTTENNPTQQHKNNENVTNNSLVKLLTAIPTVLLFVVFTIFIAVWNNQELRENLKEETKQESYSKPKKDDVYDKMLSDFREEQLLRMNKNQSSRNDDNVLITQYGQNETKPNEQDTDDVTLRLITSQ